MRSSYSRREGEKKGQPPSDERVHAPVMNVCLCVLSLGLIRRKKAKRAPVVDLSNQFIHSSAADKPASADQTHTDLALST